MSQTLEFVVRSPFMRIFPHDDYNPPRFSVAICHRRAGKTVASIQRLIYSATTNPPLNARYAYIAPLRHQAKTIAWDLLKRMSETIRGIKINEAELRIDYPTGARVQLYGSDNPDALRGGRLDGVILDEVAQMPAETWTHVVRPMLADRQGWGIFIGTPQGKNAFFELWEKAEDAPDWQRFMLKAEETGFIKAEELEASRKEMSEAAFAQEFECSFTAAIVGAFWGDVLEEIENDGHMQPIDRDPSKRIVTAWDIGTRDATAIWVVQPYRGNSWAVIDYYESSGAGIDHYAGWLEKQGYLSGHAVHLAPHDIANTDWSSAGGLNRKAVAEQHGVRFERVPRVKNSQERMEQINACRLLLKRCYFHHDVNTDRGMRVYGGRLSLSLYRQDYNERLGALRAEPLHDRHSHAADAWRTFSQLPEERLYASTPDPYAGVVRINRAAAGLPDASDDRRGTTIGPRGRGSVGLRRQG